MSKSILVIDTPKSCGECPMQIWYRKLDGVLCIPLMEEVKDIEHIDNRCPLQDTTELLEALEEIMEEDSDDRRLHCANDYNKLYKALGGE